MTKPLQTTIAGSLPKPAWLATPGELWAPWRLDGEALAEGWRDAVSAEILNAEAQANPATGGDAIQFDEPAFNVYFDEVADWGMRTLERAAQDLRCTTAVHICYGYGIKANIDWKRTLGGEWRQ